MSFGARAPSGPTGELKHSFRPLPVAGTVGIKERKERKRGEERGEEWLERKGWGSCAPT